MDTQIRQGGRPEDGGRLVARRGRAIVIHPAASGPGRAILKMRYGLGAARRLLRRARGRAAARIAVVYVYPIVGAPEHDAAALRFVATYREFPGMQDHSLHVVLNGGAASAEQLGPFEGLSAQFHRHDDSGWDIGAFQEAAREVDCDLMVFLGGNSYFRRSGWLRRVAEESRAHGDGLYGASASYELGPHIRTTAFWCDPILIRACARRVRTYEDRYEFEHGATSITNLAKVLGLGRWLVTWDGVYGEGEWRRPENIFRRGDQSNSLVFDRYFDLWEAMDGDERRHHAALADARVDASGAPGPPP